MKNLFNELENIHARPGLYEVSTLPILWNDAYISGKMLEAHLDEDTDAASRNMAFIDKSVDWIISEFHIGENSRICDFGCGPGLYTTRFAKQGARVRGIDLSKRSIAYAKKVSKASNLDIDYVCHDYLDYSDGKLFNLVTMIYCDFCALTSAQQKTALRKLYESLENNGVLIFDVCSINHYLSINEDSKYEFVLENGFWSSNPHFIFHDTFKYEKEHVVLDKYAIIEEDQIREVYNWIKCFDLPNIKALLIENGFDSIDFYSNVCGDEYSSNSKEIGIVARKT